MKVDCNILLAVELLLCLSRFYCVPFFPMIRKERLQPPLSTVGIVSKETGAESVGN